MFQFFKKLISKKKPIVIVIRGAPSTGKTTTAYEIRRKLPNSFILSIDNLIAMNVPEEVIGDERIESWGEMRPFGQELGHVLTSYLLKKEKNVIIEEMLPDVAGIKKLVKLASSLEAKPFVFELTAPPGTIMRREKMRKHPNPEKPVKMIMNLLAKNPYPKAIKIDTSDLSPREVADLILDKIRKTGVL